VSTSILRVQAVLPDLSLQVVPHIKLEFLPWVFLAWPLSLGKLCVGIRGIPALLLFKDGQRVQQIVGVRPKGEIFRMAEKFIRE